MTTDPPAAVVDPSPTPPAVVAHVDAARVSRVVGAAIVALLVAYAGGVALRRAGHDLWNLVPLTDVNHEQSIPTWFSALVLAAVAGLLVVVGLDPPARTTRRRWFALAVLVALMSADEVASYHETWVQPVRNRLDVDGLLLQAWVIPGTVVVAVVALSQIRFVRRLPAATARGLLLGAAVFLAGALVMEMIGAKLGDDWRTDSVGYEVLVAIEEALEMAGAAIVLHTLLAHLGRSRPLLLRFDPPS